MHSTGYAVEPCVRTCLLLVWKRKHIWYCVPPSKNVLTGHIRKIEVLARSRAQDRNVYYVTCVRLSWVSSVVDTTI